jgi:tetratricopeptide (TPR) repeat protein
VASRPIAQLPFTLKQLLIGAGGLVALIILIAVVAGGGAEKKPGKPTGRVPTPAVNTPQRPPPDPAPRIIEQAEALLASDSYEAAASLLRKARKEHPDNAEIAYLAGRAYFGQLWWADGIDSFRAAIMLDPTYREDPDLLKAVLKGFLTTPGVDDRILSFMRHDIGAPMRPYLEETAAKHPNKTRRARARAELDAKR